MKVDFGNISDNHIKSGKVFYVYGNYKKSFNVFCDFLVEKFKNKFKCESEEIKILHVSFSEFMKIKNDQCDLFQTQTRFFCIRNIEDSHIDKLNNLFQFTNDIFILDSADYRKSKKITDFCVKHDQINSVASFKNDSTLISLCKMMFPSVPNAIYYDIIKIINNTDEELASLFRKISLLLDEENLDMLKQYATYKQSFLEDMDFIPFVRYLLKLSIQQKIYNKKNDFINVDISKKNAIEILIKSEIYNKVGLAFGKSYIYQSLQSNEIRI